LENSLTSDNMANVIISTINTILENLFSSIDNSLYSVLDDITFISSDILETSQFQKLLGMSASNGILLIANSLLLGYLIYFSTKYLLSHFYSIEIEAPKRLKAVDIKTMPYPGFPTDMQSVFTSILTTAKGTSVVVENIFENRYRYINELNKVGAKTTVEGKIAVIKGVRKLSPAELTSTDLRGGAAMCTVALAIKGKTKINDIEYILRGYENLDKKLTSLGAKITKIK